MTFRAASKQSGIIPAFVGNATLLQLILPA
jgi:hypothetical protein